jgi:integrase/recombinase XerC/integrase/recombinase XerD
MGAVTRREVLQYKDHLLSEGKSSLTVGGYLTAIRKFYEWAEACKYYPNVAKGIKTPPRAQQFKREPLSPEQAAELLTTTATPRENALLSLLLRTGLRTIEVSRATVGDIDVKGGARVLYVHGKGRAEKDNFVILTEKALAPLAAYLKTRGINVGSPTAAQRAEPLFASDSQNSKGEALSTRSISQIAKDALRKIGLDARAYTAHSLRHTAGTNILRAGGTLEQVQFTLRHSNPATTQIYVRTELQRRRLENSGEAILDGVF